MKYDTLIFLAVLACCAILQPSAHAGDCTPYNVQCEQVESIDFGIAYDLASAGQDVEKRKTVVVGIVFLFPQSYGEMLQAMQRCSAPFMPIYADKSLLTRWDVDVRMSNGFYFTGDTWAEVRNKALAICPEKMPDTIPQQVLDHRPE